MNPVAVAARGSAVVVALVAGASSFRHIADVAIGYGEHPAVAFALPFAIDGLMVTATAAMIEDQRAGRSVRWSARVAFAFGVIASLGANIASAHPSVGARIVAAVPAVALLLAIEVLTRSGNPLSAPARTQSEILAGQPDVPAEQPAAHESAAVDAPEAPRLTPKLRRPAAETRRLVAVLTAEDPSLTREQLAARLGITARRLRTVLTSAAA